MRQEDTGMERAPETSRRRALAAGLDVALALVVASAFFATTALVMTVFIMTSSGTPMPDTLLGLSPAALAFWAFELFLLTPLGWLSTGAGVTAGALGWLSRRGFLAHRSPGMVIAGIARRPTIG
jgi:hypothetical protein